MQYRGGSGLVEVPVERDPQHHGDLPRGASRGLEIRTGGVRHGGYEEPVIAKGGRLEGVGVRLLWPVPIVTIVLSCRFIAVRLVVFSVEDHGPSYRKSAMVGIKLISLEEEPGEDRRYGKIPPVGQVDGLRTHHGGVDVEILGVGVAVLCLSLASDNEGFIPVFTRGGGLT